MAAGDLTHATRRASAMVIAGGALISAAVGQTLNKTGEALVPAGSFFDFDAGEPGDRVNADLRYVIAGEGQGLFLEPLNGAGLGVLHGPRSLYASCSSNIEELRASRINLDALSADAYVCLRTSENRPGVLRVVTRGSGKRDAISIGFTIWERPSVKPEKPKDNVVILNPGTKGADAQTAPTSKARDPKSENDAPPASHPDSAFDNPGKDPLFEPPIDPAVKPGAQGPKGETSDVPAGPMPRDPGDKPGAPGPKGGDESGGQNTDDLPESEIQRVTSDIHCPSRQTIRTNLLTKSMGDLGWRGAIESWSNGPYFREARVDVTRTRVMCRYSAAGSFHNNMDYGDGFFYPVTSFDFNFEITTPGTCENVSGFLENSGGGLICNGNMGGNSGAQFHQGVEPESCMLRCPAAPGLGTP